MQEPIYLDHNATTPMDKRVLEKMLPYFCYDMNIDLLSFSAHKFYGPKAASIC